MRLEASIDGWDVDAEGETWPELWLAYAKECREGAAYHQRTVDALIREAEYVERCIRKVAESDPDPASPSAVAQ